MSPYSLKSKKAKIYAKILGKLRKKVNLDASESTVVCARATSNGDCTDLFGTKI